MTIRLSSTQYAATLASAQADATLVVPAAFAIRNAFIRNKTANVVTGGIRIGTTNGGSEVIGATPIGANALVHIPTASLLLIWFSVVADTTLYFQAVTAWNSASLDVVLTLDKAAP